METRIKALHFEVSEKLVDFINKKIAKLARRFPAANTADVTLRVVKPETSMNKEVLIVITAPETEMVATKVANTFEEATDQALEALERQLEKHKETK